MYYPLLRGCLISDEYSPFFILDHVEYTHWGVAAVRYEGSDTPFPLSEVSPAVLIRKNINFFYYFPTFLL